MAAYPVVADRKANIFQIISNWFPWKRNRVSKSHGKIDPISSQYSQNVSNVLDDLTKENEILRTKVTILRHSFLKSKRENDKIKHQRNEVETSFYDKVSALRDEYELEMNRFVKSVQKDEAQRWEDKENILNENHSRTVSALNKKHTDEVNVLRNEIESLNRTVVTLKKDLKSLALSAEEAQKDVSPRISSQLELSSMFAVVLHEIESQRSRSCE